MTTTYPGTVDSFDTHVDSVDDVMAADVNNLNDAVVATQTTLGASGATGLCEGRLTLLTATPVTLASQTAKTTVYWAPYKGNRISIYDGSSGWDTLEFTEKSVAVPATTTTPFDIFGYNSSGSLALSTTDWTNDTTRATALTTQDGVYVKTGATGYRYLGTGRTTGTSGQTEDSVTKRFLWNYYNRVLRYMYKTDTTVHTYTTAAYRSWNNDATQRVEFVVGAAEEYVMLDVLSMVDQQAGEGVGYVSAGVDVTNNTSLSNPCFHTTIGYAMGLSAQQAAAPAIGYHYVQIVEYGAATSPDFTRAQIRATLQG